MRIITLLTDFGNADPFVGIMKGVILTINPRVEIVDLCHGVPLQDVLEAAFLLHSSYRYFPTGTIHVVVVDPGVGSQRRPLLAEGVHGYYIAPDNGVLSYLFASGEIQRVVEITAEAYFLRPVSQTFHGRDIFAPVAAHLSGGETLDRFGRPTSTYVRLALPAPEKKGEGHLIGSVLHVDRFGNLVTNISASDVSGFREFKILVKTRKVHGLVESYDSLKAGETGVILGSAGHLEIFTNRGSAARVLKAKRGTTVRVVLERKASVKTPQKPSK
ncbi:MAG: S-adenosyl-l-methionine hydroxide adenosyltransferase family protein [Candidatus Methylomirabilales bacterium]